MRSLKPSGKGLATAVGMAMAILLVLVQPGETARGQQSPDIILSNYSTATCVYSSLMVAGNVDDDPYPDVLTEFDYGTVTLLRGFGNGTLGWVTTWSPCKDCRGVNFGDMDNDGHNDIVALDYGNNQLKIMYGDGNGGFWPVQSMECDGCRRWVSIDDLDGDGNLDMVASSNFTNTAKVFMGNGGGAFSASSVPVTLNPRTNELADFNNDCIPDLLIAGWGSGGVAVLLGTEPGSFGEPTIYPMAAKVADATVGDFNADGCLDMVAASYDEKILTYWLGDCQGGFAEAGSYQVAYQTHDIAVADFNCDGLDDFVTVARGKTTLTVFKNNGAGFDISEQSYAGYQAFTVDTADFDLDGRLDVAVMDRRSPTSNIHIFLNETLMGECRIPPRDNLCMPDPTPPGEVGACITNPADGRKFNGNLMLVKADICMGDPAQTTRVEFQWRPAGEDAWNEIDAWVNNGGNELAHTDPIAVHWDVSGLANDDYEIRAVAYDGNMAADPEPGVTTFTVDRNQNRKTDELKALERSTRNGKRGRR